MSSVPLRFGMPDVGTADGQAVVGKMLRGQLKVRGTPARRASDNQRVRRHIRRM